MSTVNGHTPYAINPVDFYRTEVSQTLASVTDLKAEDIYSKLQWSKTLDNGDLNLPVAALKVKGAKPVELALQWADKFPETKTIQKPTASGQVLQFFFQPIPLAQKVLSAILGSKELYGTNHQLGLRDPLDESRGRKRIIIEFSSPNIAKPFHAGHLRSTIIGGFLANLYESVGWEVLRINYLGDWGRQFGLLANAFETCGSEEKLAQDPIGHLYDIYVEINRVSAPEEEKIKEKKEELKQAKASGKDAAGLEKEVTSLEAGSTNEKARKYFKRLEGGDPAALATWKRFRDLSIDKYKQTYARLNIRYDHYSGESQVEPERMERAAKEMEETGVSEVSDGAVIVDFTKDPKTKKLEKAVVKKKDGSTLYLTRDISEAMKRYELYHFDKMIYVVASQQDLHLKQFFKILELMGHKELVDRCEHVNFGMVLGMSTRRGTVKFLDDILRDVGDRMLEVMQQNPDKFANVQDPRQTADLLGISAVMVQDLSGKRINNYEFSLDRMTATEGDTGPYLQYAHARLCSIAREIGLSHEELQTADFSLLKEDHAIKLIRVLAQWPDQVQNTLKTMEPTNVLKYLFEMTHVFSGSYRALRVKGSEPELKKARMALYECARQVLNNGMRLLGLTPVERM